MTAPTHPGDAAQNDDVAVEARRMDSGGFWALQSRLEQALLDEAPNWATVFADGNEGTVCGVPDAATVSARFIERNYEAEMVASRSVIEQVRAEHVEGKTLVFRQPAPLAEHQGVLESICRSCRKPFPCPTVLILGDPKTPSE